jgi:hypothetical protein
LKGYFVRIKWWLLFIRGVNTRRDIQLEKILSEYDAKGGGRERDIYYIIKEEQKEAVRQIVNGTDVKSLIYQLLPSMFDCIYNSRKRNIFAV